MSRSWIVPRAARSAWGYLPSTPRIITIRTTFSITLLLLCSDSLQATSGVLQVLCLALASERSGSPVRGSAPQPEANESSKFSLQTFPYRHFAQFCNNPSGQSGTSRSTTPIFRTEITHARLQTQDSLG